MIFNMVRASNYGRTVINIVVTIQKVKETEKVLFEIKGLYTWNNGTTYNGEWKQNMMNGSGEYKYCDGRIYKGQFLNNKLHG